MAKVSPEKRWRKHVIECFVALRQSGELDRLSKKGLTILGRKKRFTAEEWFKGFSKRASSPVYREWHDECEAIGKRFGLAPWTVVCTCLVSRYDPRKQPFVMEAQWPQIRIITENTNSLFLQWLSHEAQRLGLYVVQRQGSVETTFLYLDSPPSSALPPSQRPPRDSAFYLRVETPPGYPPEAAQKLQSEGDRLTKELLGHLGYSIPKRLRSSRLVPMAEKLRVAGGPVTKREAEALGIAIIDDLYGDDDLTKDRKRLKLIASRRHKLRKRLIKPYEP